MAILFIWWDLFWILHDFTVTFLWNLKGKVKSKVVLLLINSA
jgi:hypothetical protein